MAETNVWGREIAAGDDMAPEQKAAAAEPTRAWYDLVCNQCGRHCCQNCTADGDYQRCAQTRFSNCSVCGHASSNHRAVRR